MFEISYQQIQTKKQSASITKSNHSRLLSAYSMNPPIIQQVIGNQSAQRLLRSRLLQTKRMVNPPKGNYDQKMDRVAEKMMSMSESCQQCQRVPEEEEKKKVQAKTMAERITHLVQREAEPEVEEEEAVQKKGVGGGEVSRGLEAQIRSLRGGGQPLPESARRFFEPRFGYDLSRVRVHTGTKAAEMARAVNARAFTVGNDVVFGTGQYAPGTKKSMTLISHELTHVVQQSNFLGSNEVDRNTLRREVEYIEEIPRSKAEDKGYIKETDDTIRSIGEKFKQTHPIQSTKKLREVYNILLKLKNNKKIKYWITRNAYSPASFYPSTGEIRIHCVGESSQDEGRILKSGRGLQEILIHEATHALLSPSMRKIGKPFGKTEEKKLVAFNEYWAYVRQYEYYNLRLGPSSKEFQVNPHEMAMREGHVQKCIKAVEIATGISFDPRIWKPNVVNQKATKKINRSE